MKINECLVLVYSKVEREVKKQETAMDENKKEKKKVDRRLISNGDGLFRFFLCHFMSPRIDQEVAICVMGLDLS